MTGGWNINAGGRIYGPFALERMRGFASEGRLAPQSLVAREGKSDWREAREEPELSDLFFQPSREPAVPDAAPAPSRDPAPTQKTLAPAPEKTDGARAHFTIVIDQKSRPDGNLDDTIASLGPAYRLLQNVWIVSTDQTVNAVRNCLLKVLGKSDLLFVVDASHGKAAWFNFGPEADVRIRRVWQKAS